MNLREPSGVDSSSLDGVEVHALPPEQLHRLRRVRVARWVGAWEVKLPNVADADVAEVRQSTVHASEKARPTWITLSASTSALTWA